MNIVEAGKNCIGMYPVNNSDYNESMAKYRSTLEYAGKTIVVHHYNGLGCEEYSNAILQNMQLAMTESSVEKLVLIDATDTVVDKSVMKAYKQLAKNTSAKLSKTAVIGATGIQRVFVNTIANLFKLNVRSFSTKEEALAWLTS